MNNEQIQEPSDEMADQEQQEASGEAGEPLELEVSELDAVKDELAETKDQWLRAVAELENLRKRSAKEQADARKYAASEFARDMIGVCENLYRALDNMTPDMLQGEENKSLKTLHDGVDMTRNELLRAFEKHGLKRIKPARGEMFDHNLHQAVSHIEDDGVDSGAIAQVIQAGYQMHDRLLQPSMVVIAKPAGG